MSRVGLEVWAPDGTKVLDVGDRVAMLIDAVLVTGPFSVTNDVLTQGTPFFLYLPMSFDGAAYPVQVSFSGSTMTVSGTGLNGYLYYGVY